MIEDYYKQYKDDWEKIRLIGLFNYRTVNSKIELTDVLSFEWDKKKIKATEVVYNPNALEDAMNALKRIQEAEEAGTATVVMNRNEFK